MRQDGDGLTWVVVACVRVCLRLDKRERVGSGGSSKLLYYMHTW